METWLFGLTNHTHDALKAKMNESVSAFDEKPRHDFIFDWSNPHHTLHSKP